MAGLQSDAMVAEVVVCNAPITCYSANQRSRPAAGQGRSILLDWVDGAAFTLIYERLRDCFGPWTQSDEPDDRLECAPIGVVSRVFTARSQKRAAERAF